MAKQHSAKRIQTDAGELLVPTSNAGLPGRHEMPRAWLPYARGDHAGGAGAFTKPPAAPPLAVALMPVNENESRRCRPSGRAGESNRTALPGRTRAFVGSSRPVLAIGWPPTIAVVNPHAPA